MKFRSILTILDKPKHAQTAFKKTMNLQDHSGAHVDLVSFCWQSMVESRDVYSVRERHRMRHEILDSRQRLVQQLVHEANRETDNLNLRTIWSDNIADWVGTFTSASHRDLVVKTVHQSKTLMHTPLDWKLLRACPAPVLLVSDKKRKPSKKIVAALDLRHTDAIHQRLNRKVMKAAVAYAELYDAKVHCVSTVEISKVLTDLDVIDKRTTKRKHVERTKELLDSLLEPYNIPKSRMHYPVGKVGLTVNQLCHKLNADLLVVGTCAHRAKQSVGLGNSAERIVTRAVCDVLAVRP